jgi:hypothetical protein
MKLFRGILACLLVCLPLAWGKDDPMALLATLPKCAVSFASAVAGMITDRRS